MKSRNQSSSPGHAIRLLQADHEEGQALFEIYERIAADGSAADKSALASRICGRLTDHVRAGEEIFYPALRQAIAEPGAVDEALVALAGTKALISQVAALEPADAHHDAAVAALGECFRSHVSHVQSRIFSKATGARLDMRSVGARPGSAALPAGA
jgi:Hemerythrin HHE cation binding domain